MLLYFIVNRIILSLVHLKIILLKKLLTYLFTFHNANYIFKATNVR